MAVFLRLFVLMTVIDRLQLFYPPQDDDDAIGRSYWLLDR